jgi:hypothetical protein
MLTRPLKRCRRKHLDVSLSLSHLFLYSKKNYRLVSNPTTGTSLTPSRKQRTLPSKNISRFTATQQDGFRDVSTMWNVYSVYKLNKSTFYISVLTYITSKLAWTTTLPTPLTSRVFLIEWHLSYLCL